MNEQASRFVGGIPENYDQGLGPYIFLEYADDLARRASQAKPGHVLELACGTGILTRKLRDALSPDALLTATDLNAPMLGIAKQKFDTGEKVTFKTADAMALPFEDADFDLVICQFGVMFFPDKQASYREAGRVLRSGGRYLLNVWGSMAENPFSECANDVTKHFFPDDPPGFYKVPFGYAEQSTVMADMKAGGLQNITCETITFQKDVADWALFAHGIVYGNPLIAEIKARGGVEPEEVEQSVLSSLRERFGPEPSSMPLLATVYSGEAP